MRHLLGRRLRLLGALAILATVAVVAAACAGDAEVVKETVIVPGEKVVETVIVPGEKVVETVVVVATPTASAAKPPTGPTGRVDAAVWDIRFPIGTPQFSVQQSYNEQAGMIEPLVIAEWTDETRTDLKAVPLLATEWSVDPSLEFAEFKIKKGVKFHPYKGQQWILTPEDVAWSYNNANSRVTTESVHDTAGDLAANFGEMTVRAGGVVRVPFVIYTSHFLLRNLSTFFEAPAVHSKKLFDLLGAEGMRDVQLGTGPFIVKSWTRNGALDLEAFADYHGGQGMPTIKNVRIIEAREDAVRTAMLETGQVAIAQIAITDWEGLLNKGFKLGEEGYRSTTAYAFGGNWHEKTSVVTGQPLERTLNLDKPWVSGAKEDDPTRWESARLVRQALGTDIRREDIIASIFVGQGVPNYVPGWDPDVPGHKDEWKYDFDPVAAKAMMTEAGYPTGGFAVDMWVGPSDVNSQLAEAVCGQWEADLGVTCNIDKQVYGTYRPTIINRTTSAVWGCGTDGVNVPLTWPKGFLVSSVSAGGFMCGNEIQRMGEIYVEMAALTDKARLMALTTEFYDIMRYEAPQVGVSSVPSYPLYNPEVIASWDMIPEGKGSMGGLNSLHRIKLK